MKTRILRDTLITALAPLAWGTTYFVTTEWLPPGRPLFVGTMRVLPVGLLLLLWTRRLPSGVWWWRSAVLGSVNIGVFFALLFVAAYRLPGGVAATMGALQPLIVIAIVWFVLGERPPPLTVLAACTGVVGVGLLVLGPAARLDGLGIAAALGGTFAMACGTVLTKRWERPVLVSPILQTAV